MVKRGTKRDKEIYEKTMSQMVSAAILGLLFFPIIGSIVSLVKRWEITDNYVVRSSDKWKLTLVSATVIRAILTIFIIIFCITTIAMTA
jgi:succinate dehydrogenase hydrophobic anchor subunit